MRRFRFQLAGLERLLAHREEGEKLRAAQAGADRRRAESLLGHLRGRLDAARREHVERRRERGLSPQDELLYGTYRERMGRAIAAQRGTVAKAAERHAERLEELRAASTRRRAIGLLHERRRADHRREAGRAMTRFLDEVGSRQARHPS